MSDRKTRKAYFQGAGEESFDGKITSNDPEKLGYKSKEGVGYDRKPMAVPVGEDARPWEDKSFDAAAKETKKNLGPSGAEFDVKKHWQRIPEDEKVANAKLVGGLTRNANRNDSFWTIYMVDSKGGKSPILKASLKDVLDQNPKTTKAKALNDKINATFETKEYINSAFRRIREEGFSAVGYLLTGNEGFLKRAVEAAKAKKTVTAQMGAESIAPEAPADDMGMSADMGGDAELGAALDSEVGQTSAEGEVTLELLEQKHNEVESVESDLIEKTAPETTAEVFVELQNAEKMLDEAIEEMKMASTKLKDKSLTAAQKIKLIRFAQDAQDDAIDTMSTTDDSLGKAQQALEAVNTAVEKAVELTGGEEMHEDTMETGLESAPVDATEMAADAAPVAEEVVNIEASLKGSNAKIFVAKFLKARADQRKVVAEAAGDHASEQGKYGVVPEGAPKDGAAEISSAHPQGGTTTSNVEVGGKPSDNGARVETVTEAQDHDLKVADKMPTGDLSGKSVAVAAVAGKTVVAEADPAADSACRDFFGKDLYGQGDAKSKEFGKLLYEKFDAEKKASANEERAKVVRAYELADEATEKGFCEKTADAKTKFVKEVLAFNDESFIAFKNLIASTKKSVVSSISESRVATASAKRIPNIGLVDGSEAKEEDFTAKLTALNWK